MSEKVIDSVLNIHDDIWLGYLQVQNLKFPVYLELVAVAEDDSGTKSQRVSDECQTRILFESSAELRKLLEETDLLRAVDFSLENHRSVGTFLADFKEILLRMSSKLEEGRSMQEGAPLVSAGFLAKVVQELEEVGWEYIESVDENLTAIVISSVDEAERKHLLRINLNEDYPEKMPTVNAELPNPMSFSVPKSEMSLKNLKMAFDGQLQRYQAFWDVLDDIDKNTWVLEPKQSDRSLTHRRIVVGQNCSIHVNISPDNPYAICELDFLGSETIVQPFRNNFNKNVHHWDWDKLLRHNLSKVLEVTFPQPTILNKEAMKLECGICYSYRLDTALDEVSNQNDSCSERNTRAENSVLPNLICDNQKCGRPYHEYCLSEWLKSLPDTKYSFDTMFGKCPVCQESISVRVSSR
mmetsp:Transcript_10494/g.12039  ORF Transcript_10494/g.12039 Transcript_10494/m.12039 type:complete len:410 (+) Transcript_10494:130-1359(+)